MRSGKLRHRIDIERGADVIDTDGQRTPGWVVWAQSLPAQYEPSSAREFTAAQAVQSEVVGFFVVRWIDGVLASDRIRFGTQIFNIAGALADAKSGREYLTIPVSTGVDQG